MVVLGVWPIVLDAMSGRWMSVECEVDVSQANDDRSRTQYRQELLVSVFTHELPNYFFATGLWTLVVHMGCLTLIFKIN